jgi:two-component system sensor histidine kinase UhpB
MDVKNGTLVEVNDAYCRLVGYSREELVGQTISQVEPRKTPEETARHIQQLIEKGQDRFETQHRCKDGTIIDVEVSSTYMALNEKNYVFIRDISDRKRFIDDLEQKNRYLQELSSRLCEIAEEERKQLSMELHDQIGQNLTALGINLNILKSSPPSDLSESVRNRLQDSIELVDQTTHQLRNLSTQFRPPALDDFGLVAALHGVAGPFFKRTGIAVDIVGEEINPRPPENVEINLFRITQEALINAAKYARANRVTITLQSSGKRLRLSIADDGVGFDPDRLERDGRGDRLGLISMSERALAVGGTCRVESKPGQGTTVTAEVPVP